MTTIPKNIVAKFIMSNNCAIAILFDIFLFLKDEKMKCVVGKEAGRFLLNSPRTT